MFYMCGWGGRTPTMAHKALTVNVHNRDWFNLIKTERMEEEKSMVQRMDEARVGCRQLGEMNRGTKESRNKNKYEYNWPGKWTAPNDDNANNGPSKLKQLYKKLTARCSSWRYHYRYPLLLLSIFTEKFPHRFTRISFSSSFSFFFFFVLSSVDNGYTFVLPFVSLVLVFIHYIRSVPLCSCVCARIVRSFGFDNSMVKCIFVFFMCYK